MGVVDQVIDITTEERKTILRLLERYLPGTAAWIYGSRAKWTSSPESDLDVVVFAMPEQHLQVGNLREALDESNLPFRVDLFVWDNLSDSFRQQIESDHVVLVADVRLDSPRIGWVSLTLGDVCTKIGSGATPRGGSGVYLKDGPVSLIRSQNVYNDGFRLDGLAFINEQQATKLRNVEVHAGDVLLNITGDSVARACQVAPEILPARVNQHVAIIRPDSRKLSARFLRYYLIDPKTQTLLLSWAGSGGTRNALTKGIIESLRICAPVDVTKQRAIAHILGTLDDKIELNSRMNETLEAISRALFKSWFVDFDPVRAKMEGRDTGLPKHIEELFPDRLDSEGLPIGWLAGTIGDNFRLTMGQSPPGSTYNDYGEGLPFFQGKTDFAFRYPKNRRYCSAPIRIAERDDTLVSVRAPVGDINMAWERCCIGRGVAALRHRSGSVSFTYYAALAIRHKLKIYEHSGTVFGAINKKQLKALSVVEPTPGAVSLVNTVISPLDKRIRKNVAENRILAHLRDCVLPKLLSGEMRLQWAEQVVESVT